MNPDKGWPTDKPQGIAFDYTALWGTVVKAWSNEAEAEWWTAVPGELPKSKWMRRHSKEFYGHHLPKRLRK